METRVLFFGDLLFRLGGIFQRPEIENIVVIFVIYRSALKNIATPLLKNAIFKCKKIFKTVTNTKNVIYKNFLEFYLVYKNVCLKFLRQKLQKLEIGIFDKISPNFHFFFYFHKVEKIVLKNFRSIICPQIS